MPALVFHRPLHRRVAAEGLDRLPGADPGGKHHLVAVRDAHSGGQRQARALSQGGTALNPQRLRRISSGQGIPAVELGIRLEADDQAGRHRRGLRLRLRAGLCQGMQASQAAQGHQSQHRPHHPDAMSPSRKRVFHPCHALLLCGPSRSAQWARSCLKSSPMTDRMFPVDGRFSAPTPLFRTPGTASSLCSCCARRASSRRYA